jgi:hypothetical protein
MANIMKILRLGAKLIGILAMLLGGLPLVLTALSLVCGIPLLGIPRLRWDHYDAGNLNFVNAIPNPTLSTLVVIPWWIPLLQVICVAVGLFIVLAARSDDEAAA